MASIGLLVFQSSHSDSFADLLEVLDLKKVLRDKKSQGVVKDEQINKLCGEVAKLV